MDPGIQVTLECILVNCATLSVKFFHNEDAAAQSNTNRQSLCSMLKVLVCACLLAVRINASGSNEQLHQPGSPLALPSGQLDAIPEPGGGEYESSKPSDRMIHPQRPTDRNNTGSRAGPSTSTNHNMKWVPKHREVPTRAPSPLPPKRYDSSRTREPRDIRNDRRYEQRSPSDRHRSSRHHHGRSSPVTRVSIEILSKSHHRDRHSSRKHSHRLCTIRIQGEDGHISVHIHNRSNRGRSHSHRSNDYSPVGRSSDDSPRRGNLSPFDRNSPRGRNRSPVDRGDDTDRSYLGRRPSPVRRERSSRRRDSDYSPRGRNHSSRHGYSSRGRNYSPIGYGYDSDEFRVGRHRSPVRSQSSHSSRRGYESEHPQPDTLSPADITQVRDAIDRMDIETFRQLYWGNRRLMEEGLNYMVEKKSPAFIINFIKQTYTELRVLSVLLSRGSKSTIEEVFKEGKFSQDDLVDAARYIELACSPERFVDLLGRIETPKNQERAVEKGIVALIWEKCADCIEPLLTALESSKFLNRDLKNISIQAVFVAGAFYGNEIWTKGFIIILQSPLKHMPMDCSQLGTFM